MRLIAVHRIWDRAPHNAFTDLVRHQGRWFCAFREGAAHVSPDGALRVLTSVDAATWEPAALLASGDADLRDAKLSVTPAGELMLSAAAALYDTSRHSHQTLAWFSRDGRTWSDFYPIGDPDFWLWRITWHEATAYSVGYATRGAHGVRLYHSRDGLRFETLVPSLFDAGFPNEATLVFEDDTARCLLRRDGNPHTGLLGIAEPPYTTWRWQDLSVRIGGPHMLRLPDGRWLAAVRLYDGRPRTALAWLDPAASTLAECLTLPSGGDTSYAGLAWHEGRLWVSYYSSHEDKTAIYLAQVALEDVHEQP